MLLHKDLKDTMKAQQIELAIQELLNQIDATTRPANEVINAYTRMRRYIGSKDRRAITDGVWQVLRARPTPEWIQKIIPESELKAMNETAQTVLRANGNRLQIQRQLQKEGVETELTPISPIGLILKKRVNLSEIKAYQNGLVEVQDEGSQLLALATKVKSGDKVLDYCAGAGGKSLAFAQMMQNQGQIQAYDITPKKLFELVKRATRAQIKIIKIITKLERPDKKFDHVVVDAPCSGCGTWRRTPNMRWHLTEKQLKHITKTQAEILNRAEQYLKIGGYLSYITCSLTFDENEQQVEKFLAEHPNYKVIKQKRYSPYLTQTDGFFLCVMQKTS